MTDINKENLSNSLARVKLKHKLKTVHTVESIVAFIVEELKTFPNYTELQNDIAFLNHVCNLVEQVYADFKIKSLPKKDIVIRIINTLFPEIEEKDLANHAENIEFLHANLQIRSTGNYIILMKMARCVKILIKFICT